MEATSKSYIIDLIKKINHSWLEGNIDELYIYLSNDVVFASPYNQSYLQGKDLCISSYRKFIKQASIHAFEASNYKIDLFDDVAVATYKFTISYTIENESYDESDYEIMVFRKFHEDWLVIWRAQISHN
jgi:hypothetical protein